MKKIISLLIVLVILLSCFSFSYADQDGIGIYIDGQKLTTAAEPVNMGGNIMVPMRDIFEAMGATVEWNQENWRIDAWKGLKYIYMQPDETLFKTMHINGRAVPLNEVPTITSSGYTIVPVRAVAEAFDATVEWKNGNVEITTNKTGYEEYSKVPDFGKMFGMQLHTKTIKDMNYQGAQVATIMYVYKDSEIPKDAKNEYMDTLVADGFHSVDIGDKALYFTDEAGNVSIIMITDQNTFAVSVMVPVPLSTLHLEATN